MTRRNGFTLVEVLVVIAIVGVLLGLVLPATQGLREMSRRSACQHNLIQLSLALSSYHDSYGHYPVGTLNPTGKIENIEIGYHHNWVSGLLPQLELQVLADQINTQVGVYAEENAVVRQASIPVLHCPSASGVRLNSTNYAATHHSVEAPIDETNDGVFILNVATRNRDIVDGLSYTLFLWEKESIPEYDFGWMSGTRSTLRNAGHRINSPLGTLPLPLPVLPVDAAWEDDQADDDTRIVPAEDLGQNVAGTVDLYFVGGIQSDHPGGAHILTGAGEVSFRAETTDQRLLSQMANKADGTIPINVLDESTSSQSDETSPNP
jgi:prepilin-type N-terminal cleavage/methylation domain-containing protein